MNRPDPDCVRRVTCVGAGTIGAGWAAVFLSRGMDVTLSDPGVDAEARAGVIIDQAWPLLEQRGLASGASRSRLRFVASPAEAVSDAEFVQESAPNRLQAVVFTEMAALVRDGVCDYEDIDAAMTFGPGLRWAFAGPVMCYHLGGGKGGVRHMLEHFGWQGEPAEADALVAAVERMAGHMTLDELERWRDRNLLSMLDSLQPLPPKP